MVSDPPQSDAARADPSALCARIGALYPELPLPPEACQPGHAAALPASLHVAAGTVLFDQASPCQGFPLVLQGELRVARGAPGGRSLELYRVGPGELCVVSTAALFGRAPMPAHGVALQDCELVLVDAQRFSAWTAHEGFRRHVFSLFAERLADVISLAEAVAFHRLDQRLAAALLGHGALLKSTHQGLADELGTVREIVTRLLRRFERAGWVVLGRERIEVRDAAALRRLAAGSPVED